MLLMGPIYIGKNAEIQEGCLIRGPFALCEGSRVKMGTKIYGATTIGPYCLAGGEIKNSILMGYSNKSHDGYLGDSVIGDVVQSWRRYQQFQFKKYRRYCKSVE